MSDTGPRPPSDPRAPSPQARSDQPAASPASASPTPAPATPSPETAPGGRRWRKRQLWIGGIGAAILLGVGVWFVTTSLPRLLTTSDTAAPPATTAGASETRRIRATLLYVSDDGTLLAPMIREVPYGATPAEQVLRILEAEVAPPEGRTSAIPTGTTIRRVFLTSQGEAYVDVSGTIVSAHTGGSLDEALTVYTIVDVIALNMPEIGTVQILVDGKAVDSIAGHLDLRHPLGKALDWIERGQ